MAKLGYTWYPKDWGNSESVFELNLSERGLYRELIDLSMLNDNKTEIKIDIWTRKFCVSEQEINKILEKLSKLELIIIKKTNLFIPSCEPRLNLSRGGSLGGKTGEKNNPNPKGVSKPIPKPIPNQIEIESKIESKIEIKEEILNSKSWLESLLMKRNINLSKGNIYLGTFLDCQEDLVGEGVGLNRNEDDIKNHFVKWLDNELKKEQEKSIKVQSQNKIQL